MAGIRIHHSGGETTCVFLLVDGSRPYFQPYDCPACHQIHTFKTYHIDIDGEGFAIVSVEVWERLQRIQLNPFILANEVKHPPKKVVAVGFANRPGVIVGLDGKEIRSGR